MLQTLTQKPQTVVGQRLTRAIFLTSFAAVLAACTVLGIHHVQTFRGAAERTMMTVGDTLSLGLADALRFDDQDTARSILSSTANTTEILGVAVYDGNGELFAERLTTQGQASFPRRVEIARQSEGTTRDSRKRLESTVVRPIRVDGRSWGTIVICWSTREILTAFTTTLFLVGALVLAVILLSSLATQRLRRDVGEPLAVLAEAAGESTGAGDSRNERRDEIEVLRRALDDSTRMRGLVRLVEETNETVTENMDALRLESRAMRRDAQQQSEFATSSLRTVSKITRSASDVSTAVQRVATRFEETTTSMRELNASGAEIDRQVEGLLESVDTATAGSQDGAESLETVAANIAALVHATTEMRNHSQQLAGSVAIVERRAVEAKDISGSARDSANEGAAIVEKTKGVIEEVDGSFDSLRDSVEDLTARCNQIADSLGVIESIADETNLLALNAAIIAAQSGEHGRAFAVVADSVRGLAVRTVQSAREIHGSLDALRSSANHATATVAGAGAKVQEGVEHSNQANEALEHIMAASSTAAEHGDDITRATIRQQEDLEVVRSAIGRVDELAERISESIGDQKRVGSEIVLAMERVRAVSGEVGQLVTQQREETEKVSLATEDVEGQVSSIREETRSQADAGEAINTRLEELQDAAKTTKERSETLHGIVEALSEQTGRLDRSIRRPKAGGVAGDSNPRA